MQEKLRTFSLAYKTTFIHLFTYLFTYIYLLIIICYHIKHIHLNLWKRKYSAATWDHFVCKWGGLTIFYFKIVNVFSVIDLIQRRVTG